MKALYAHVALLLIGSIKICPAAGERRRVLLYEYEPRSGAIDNVGGSEASPPQPEADLTDFRSEVPKLSSLATQAVSELTHKDDSLETYLKANNAVFLLEHITDVIRNAKTIQQIMQVFANTNILLDRNSLRGNQKNQVARWLKNRLQKASDNSQIPSAQSGQLYILNQVLSAVICGSFAIQEEHALDNAVCLLTKSRADIDHYDGLGYTPLVRTAIFFDQPLSPLNNQPLQTAILLKYGAAVNAPDAARNRCPLMFLIAGTFSPNHWKKENVRKVFALLLQHGAIVTPEMLAPRANMPPDILSKLREAYARQQATAAQGALNPVETALI